MAITAPSRAAHSFAALNGVIALAPFSAASALLVPKSFIPRTFPLKSRTGRPLPLLGPADIAAYNQTAGPTEDIATLEEDQRTPQRLWV